MVSGLGLMTRIGLMSEADAKNVSGEVVKRHNGIGTAGLVIASIGLTISLLGPWLGQLVQPAPKPAEEEIADFAAKIIKGVKERLKRQQPPPPPAPKQLSWPAVFAFSAVAAGLIGVLLGITSWVRREDHRLSGSAVAVGAAAIAWQYLLLAVAIAVALVLLYIVFASIDLG